MTESVTSLKPKAKRIVHNPLRANTSYSFPLNLSKSHYYPGSQCSLNSQLWQLPFPIGSNLWYSHLGYPIFSWFQIILETLHLVAVIAGRSPWFMELLSIQSAKWSRGSQDGVSWCKRSAPPKEGSPTPSHNVRQLQHSQKPSIKQFTRSEEN